jgi:hypothetical protein
MVKSIYVRAVSSAALITAVITVTGAGRKFV